MVHLYTASFLYVFYPFLMAQMIFSQIQQASGPYSRKVGRIPGKSYRSAQVLLNLLNKLEERDQMPVLEKQGFTGRNILRPIRINH